MTKGNEIKPWEKENWRHAKGIKHSEGETNPATALRDYSINCIAPSENLIAVANGYHLWWCTAHYQPLAWCQNAAEAAQKKEENDGDCPLCGKPTISFSANPNEWPAELSALDQSGVIAHYHRGCVMNCLIRAQKKEEPQDLRKELAFMVAEIVHEAHNRPKGADMSDLTDKFYKRLTGNPGITNLPLNPGNLDGIEVLAGSHMIVEEEERAEKGISVEQINSLYLDWKHNDEEDRSLAQTIYDALPASTKLESLDKEKLAQFFEESGFTQVKDFLAETICNSFGVPPSLSLEEIEAIIKEYFGELACDIPTKGASKAIFDAMGKGKRE